ncbi:paREP2b [Pyrobaculum aerophilum str. IM2]|uniref:PaREP2b n=1 Tax=Pyrobaculum aerophilum (strain ATCC 51768 / DSM 7523 / JCM 9630 / CIP 104966 / NBRC 100827 / IM2) TaxID=178306 RepID=Q8ZWV6_PYRAE|nr:MULTISPECIES: PaRep2b protein [Pyrobaculum]AAL63593.1 paREP2b [Pyrobaculum aerophilum str. IM2]
MHKPTSPVAFDAAVMALKDAGFEEGVHFIAKRPEGGKPGHSNCQPAPGALWSSVDKVRNGPIKR